MHTLIQASKCAFSTEHHQTFIRSLGVPKYELVAFLRTYYLVTYIVRALMGIRERGVYFQVPHQS